MSDGSKYDIEIPKLKKKHKRKIKKEHINNGFKWKNKNAIKHYNFLLETYGEPTALSKELGGFAVWTSKMGGELADTCISEITCMYTSRHVIISFSKSDYKGIDLKGQEHVFYLFPAVLLAPHTILSYIILPTCKTNGV